MTGFPWEEVKGKVFSFALLAGLVLFYLCIAAIAIGFLIAIAELFIVYALPAILALGLAIYFIYGLVVFFISIPFAFAIFVVGLSTGQRSSSFHRTRNLFTSAAATLLVADIFDISLAQDSLLQFAKIKDETRIEAYLPGIWCIAVSIIYLQLMRQIFFDGFDAVSKFERKELTLWKMAKWPPASLIGIVSDFAIPTFFLMSLLGVNSDAFEYALTAISDHLNTGFIDFSQRYLGHSFDIKGVILNAFESKDSLIGWAQMALNNTIEMAKSLVHYWYEDFL